MLVLLLIVLLVFAVPAWPYSSDWGYGPSGIVGLLLVVLLLMLLLGAVPWSAPYWWGRP